MTDAELCPEHVWELTVLETGDDGRLVQHYGCARCSATKQVGPDEAPPGTPDFPA